MKRIGMGSRRSVPFWIVVAFFALVVARVFALGVETGLATLVGLD